MEEQIVFPLLRKHLLKNLKHPALGLPVNFAQIPDEPFPVNGAELVQDNLPAFILKRAGYSRWVITPCGGHRGHDNGLNVTVHFVW